MPEDPTVWIVSATAFIHSAGCVLEGMSFNMREDKFGMHHLADKAHWRGKHITFGFSALVIGQTEFCASALACAELSLTNHRTKCT